MFLIILEPHWACIQSQTLKMVSTDSDSAWPNLIRSALYTYPGSMGALYTHIREVCKLKENSSTYTTVMLSDVLYISYVFVYEACCEPTECHVLQRCPYKQQRMCRLRWLLITVLYKSLWHLNHPFKCDIFLPAFTKKHCVRKKLGWTDAFH